MSEVLAQAADVQGRIARLFIYPVKSCAGIEASEALLTETGLALDRAWMLVDQRGRFVTQRDQPHMALVQPELARGGAELILRAPGMQALHLPAEAVQTSIRVQIWNDEAPAFDMGDAAARWFSDFLSRDEQGQPRTDAAHYRLVRFDPSHRRLSDLQWTGGAEALNQFDDGYPVLVLSQASLDGLNERLAQRGQAPVDVLRFRPNLVLAGLQAHDEDRVGSVHIDTAQGPAVLKPVKPCPRCPIPNIDPLTALSSPAVGDALQTYRQDARLNGAVTFGMNAIITSGVGAVLRVGQCVSADFSFD